VSKSKTISVFTSSRADFFPAKPLLDRISKHTSFKLELIVSGGHLLKSQGYTLKSIIDSGFTPAVTIPFLNEDSPHEPLAISSARLFENISLYLFENRPSLLFLLGDRFEILPVANAALLLNIPIAHISGGDITLGAIDNKIRHAVSMLSDWHFPGTPSSAKKLQEMGVEYSRICMCGELGLEAIITTPTLSRVNLINTLQLNSKLPIFACTFHPETVGNKISPQFVVETIKTLLNQLNCQVVVTASNFDFGGNQINEAIKILSQQNERVYYFENLGSEKYFSLLKHSSLLIGNSSSAIIESQSFGIPAINVGDRQKGRITNPNTISCEVNLDEIKKSVGIATSNEFKNNFITSNNYYGDGGSSLKILSFIETKILSNA
jgi:GDP/UDP-N,N'-diacetylbacillosamine 2-epimerase (hydrolysing)